MGASFIRVKHTATGHELDVREDSPLLVSGAAVHVKPKLYPPSRYPRPTKYHLAVPTAARDAATDGVAEDSTDTTEE